MTVQEATSLLNNASGFEWLLSDPKIWWKVSEVAAGLGVSDGYLYNLLEAGAFLNAIKHPGAGWRIPRDTLLLYCAQLLQGGRQTSAG